MFSEKKWPSHFQKGCFIWDLDNEKLRMAMGVGTNILGYSNSKVDIKL